MRADWKREYFSIPNLMGYFRIALIPLFVICYLRAETWLEYLLAASVLGLSALTDLFDGKVARRFNMVTDWGKMLDPLADKLTQCAAVLCLCTRYPMMQWVVGLFLVKELTMLALGIISLRIGKKLNGAAFCGKLTTNVLDISVILLLLLPEMGYLAANLLCLLCMVFMVYSLAGYGLIYARMWSGRALKLPLSWPKRILILILVLLAFLGYVIAGCCLSALPQGEAGTEVMRTIDTDTYYSDSAGPDRAMLIGDNQEALEERLNIISQAEERILFATFDIRADSAGIQVLAALLDAADRGVQVRLLADGLRSWLNMEGNPLFYALSSHPNVEIRLYNKANPLCPWTLMGRTHDKYIIADDDLYLLGGRNTFSYFLGEGDGNVNYDWDVLVWNDGSAAGSLEQVEDYFYSIWNSDRVTVFHDSSSLARWPSVYRGAAKLRSLYAQLQAEEPEAFTARNYVAITEPTNQITLLHNPTNITVKEPTVFCTLLRLMEEADFVDLHTPYVICNHWMLDSLAQVCENTEVTLMTNSLANNGNPFGAAFYRQDKQALLDMGMTLLEYDGGVSYHGKALTLDGSLSIVGSFNLDQRSTYVDTELMLVIDGAEFCQVLREAMEAYEAQSLTVVDLETSLAPEGMEAQNLTKQKSLLLHLIGSGLSWAKFLM